MSAGSCPRQVLQHGGPFPHHVDDAAMDASRFSDFVAFPFAAAHVMATPVEPSPPLAFDDFSQPQCPRHPMPAAAAAASSASSSSCCSSSACSSSSSSSLPPASHAGAAVADAVFRAGSENRRSSPATSDGSTQDRNSPAAHSFEDPAADDFGLAARPDATHLGLKANDDRPGAPPAWSELKTKAGKDRKRLPLACIACRRKKIRCSGEKPACKHCLRSRIPCVYKVTARKAAPRTDYMAMLDKRLKRMEERIIKIVPKADHDAAPPVTRAVVKPAIPPAASLARPGPSRKRGLDEAFGSSHLEAWAKAPSKAKLHDAAAAAAAAETSVSVDVRQEEEDKLFREGIDALPPKDVQEHLAEVFFDNVYGQAYHLLHKPSYMRKLKSNALPPVLVLSVCAVAARFTPNPNISPNPRQFLRGEEWASHARDICTRRYEWPNVTILTCLLILGLHEFGTCHGGRSWALGGQAIRMAFALQLHKDLDHDPLCRNAKTPLTFIDREIRRRIMWACFLMDRFNSSGSDRPMFIKEESLKIQLPVDEKYFQLDMPAQAEMLDGSLPAPDPAAQLVGARESMGVAAFTIRAIALWGRIITYLDQGGSDADAHPVWSAHSDYAKLVDDVDAFAQDLPSRFRYSPENLDLQMTERTASQFLLLHLSMQQNDLFLSQAAVTLANGRAGPEPPSDFLSRVGARAFAAADRISEILRDSEKSQCYALAPFAGCCAFSSTTVHIVRIFSGNPAVKATAEANFGVNIRFLRRMMRHWGMFHWMVDNIRTQYRNAMNAPPRPSAEGAAAVSPIIHYCRDWFTRYPHGLSDADLMDPAAGRKREKGDDAVLEQKPELQSVEDFFMTLSPPQSAGGARDAQRCGGGGCGGLARRKQTAGKKQADGAAPVGAGGGGEATTRPESPPHAVGGRLAPGPGPGGAALHQQQPHQPAPAPPRRFSASLGGQTSGPAGFCPLGVPQSQPPSFTPMPSMSPVPVDRFSQRQQQQPQPPQPPSGHHSFFSADMVPMAVSQPQPQPQPQPNGLAPPLARPISFGGGFSIDSSGCVTLADGHHQPHEHSSLTSAAMAGFGGPNASTWFLPLGMDTPAAVNHGVGMGGVHAVDPFANMFGISVNPLDALGQAI